MSRLKAIRRVVQRATRVKVELVLPCGKPLLVDLVHTGLRSHQAVLTAEGLHHKCVICKHLPPWELHIFHHMTERAFQKYGYSQLDLLEPPEDPCQESK